jgi:hypothetical protein
MLITPTQEDFQPWSFHKMPNYQFESSASEVSTNVFFDAEERIRVESSMGDIAAALKELAQPVIDEEYQSSEEALSPMLEEDAGEESVGDEALGVDLEKEISWSEVEAFKVDIAIAICVTAAGKAQVVNVPQKWATFRSLQGHRSPQPRSRSPPVLSRATARAIPPRLDTNIPAHSASQSLSSASSRSLTPDSMYSTTRASHRAMSSTASATSWAATTSDQSHYSITPSFLDSDPFESASLRNSRRFRLRSISSKLKSSASSPSTELRSEEANIKQKRRRSLIQAVRPDSTQPETPPFFWSARSRDEWYRQHDAAPPRSATPPVGSSTPTQKKLPKLMARGANEREPTLLLPPCPMDYDMELPATNPWVTQTIAHPKKSSSVGLNRRKSLLGVRV